jgi:cobalt-zinc-cadmium efflux system outer membrane protein
MAAAFVAASTVQAQSPLPDEISLEELIELVREHSPAARALRADVAVADAEVDLAGVYPNPELGYVFMGRFDGDAQAINGTQHQAWIDVPLLVAGQNQARRAAAAGAARARREELAVSLLALEVEARRAFATLLAAQERAERLAAARSELDELARIVGERASAGAQSRYDEARVRLETARIDAELGATRAEVAAARASLAALVGRTGWEPNARGSLEAIRIELPLTTVPPAVRALEQRVRAAELDVTRAERERVPEIRLGIGSYLTTDPDSASVYAGLSIPLPIFDTGDAAVSRARAARAAAIEARDAADAQARARREGLLAALRTRREALERFDADAMSRLTELRAMAEASYRLGASSVFELLDTFRTRLELELERIELLEAVVHAETEVLAITGH